MKNNISETRIHIATLGEKRIVAFTSSEPYLCLEDESFEALREKLLRALNFLEKVRLDLEQQVAQIAREREQTIKPIKITRTILARELVDA